MTKIIKMLLWILVFVLSAPESKSVVADSSKRAGHLGVNSFTSKVDTYGSSGVVALPIEWNPPAIRLLVVPGDFISFYGISIGTRTHVFQEVIKGFQPSRANDNSLPSVKFPTFGFRIGASLLHGIPYSISSFESRIGRFPMPNEWSVQTKASTACCEPLAEIGEKHDFLLTAITYGRNSLSARIDNALDDHQSESSSNEVFGFGVASHEMNSTSHAEDYKK